MGLRAFSGLAARCVCLGFWAVMPVFLLLLANEALSQGALQRPRIAHAGGQFNGATYTNSLEALDRNYGAGFRAFEIDLSFTSDGELVCLHDWGESFTRSFGLPPTSPVSLLEFERLVRERSQVDKCTLDSLMRWLVAHEEAFLVTDIKERNLEALAHISAEHPQALSRTIPQIYQPAEYQVVKSLGYDELIWSLYLYSGGTQSALNYVREMDLWAVTMNTERAEGELPNLLQQLGVPTYVHTINQYADLLYLRTRGIDEIYTDSLSLEREAELAGSGLFTQDDSTIYRAKKERDAVKAESITRFATLNELHFTLGPNFPAADVTTNQISELDLNQGGLEFIATGNDPYIRFPSLRNPVEEIVIHVLLEAPDSSALEVFYATEEEPAFSEARRASKRLRVGRNELIINISAPSPVIGVRLDPGRVAGPYRVEKFEVRSKARSWARFFGWD